MSRKREWLCGFLGLALLHACDSSAELSSGAARGPVSSEAPNLGDPPNGFEGFEGQGGSSGSEGRPLCLFWENLFAPDSARTALGTLPETRTALEQALATTAPVHVTWHRQMPTETTMTIEVVRWDAQVPIEPGPYGCLELGGEFRVRTADGLIDAQMHGAFSPRGLDLSSALSAADCSPLAKLCPLFARTYALAFFHLTSLGGYFQVRTPLSYEVGDGFWEGESAPRLATLGPLDVPKVALLVDKPDGGIDYTDAAAPAEWELDASDVSFDPWDGGIHDAGVPPSDAWVAPYDARASDGALSAHDL